MDSHLSHLKFLLGMPHSNIHPSGSKASLDEDGGSQMAEEQAGDVGVVQGDTDWTTVFITKVKC